MGLLQFESVLSFYTSGTTRYVAVLFSDLSGLAKWIEVEQSPVKSVNVIL